MSAFYPHVKIASRIVSYRNLTADGCVYHDGHYDMQPWARAAHLYCGAYVDSALHLSGVAISSTGFGWENGGNVTSAGWQVTQCDPT